MDSSDLGGRNVIYGKTCHAEPSASCFGQVTYKGLVFYYECLFGSTDINVLKNRLFLTAVRDKVIISILKLLFTEPGSLF